MPIIDPPVGAIDRYLWDIAQTSIVDLLKAVSISQDSYDSDYKFVTEKDRYLPTIEDITENNHFVNVNIGTVTSEDDTNFGKTHIVTYRIDCYVQGFNQDDPDNPGSLIPPDEVAVAKLKYLCAMVEWGLSALKNFYLNDAVLTNKIIPGKMNLTFNPVQDVDDSATPYAPARFEWECKFPYEAQDLENLPALTLNFFKSESWESLITYS